MKHFYLIRVVFNLTQFFIVEHSKM